MSEKIFAYVKEGGREEFLKNVYALCQNESKMFCLIVNFRTLKNVNC